MIDVEGMMMGTHLEDMVSSMQEVGVSIQIPTLHTTMVPTLKPTIALIEEVAAQGEIRDMTLAMISTLTQSHWEAAHTLVWV